jgi:hypothetical protein
MPAIDPGDRRRAVTWLRSSFTVLLAFLVSGSTAGGQTTPRRSSIVLFQFEGVSGDAAKRAFGNFRDFLYDRQFRLLTEELQVPQDTISLIMSGSPPSNAADYWRNTDSLALIWGSLFTDGDNYRVAARVFLGDLKDGLPNPSVPLSFRIRPEEFGATKDAYSLVAAFVLAMDAERTGKPRETVIRYLSHALNLAKDLAGNPSSSNEMQGFVKAIGQHLGDLRTGPGKK